MRKQKFIFATGSYDFSCLFNEWAQDGWTLVPTSLVKTEGDRIVCVIEQEITSKLPPVGLPPQLNIRDVNRS